MKLLLNTVSDCMTVKATYFGMFCRKCGIIELCHKLLFIIMECVSV